MSEQTDRIDLWLKHVCLFRTRTEAANAVKGGHVKLNGSRVKASATVRAEDSIEITRAEQNQILRIISVPERQVPRKLSRECYEDLTPARPRPPEGPEEQRVGRGKINKKDRRELRRLKGR